MIITLNISRICSCLEFVFLWWYNLLHIFKSWNHHVHLMFHYIILSSLGHGHTFAHVLQVWSLTLGQSYYSSSANSVTMKDISRFNCYQTSAQHDKFRNIYTIHVMHFRKQIPDIWQPFIQNTHKTHLIHPLWVWHASCPPCVCLSWVCRLVSIYIKMLFIAIPV